MVLNQLIHDSFGRRYKLHLPGDGPTPKNIKPATFNDETSTRSFLMRMEVREGYWRQLYYLLSGSILQTGGSSDGIDAIVRLFMQGRILLFPINDLDVKHDSIAKRTFKLPDGNTYQFAPATEQLINSNKKTKKFASKQDALEFVRKISLKEDSLQGVVSTLSLPLPTNSVQSNKQEVLESTLADAIVEENVFVFEDMPNKPAVPKIVYEDVQVKPVTLGPEPNENPIKVTAKIDAEYKVVLFDKQLSKHQDSSEEKVQTDATIIEFWLEQDTSSPVFDQGAKIDLSGTGKIQAFIDEQLTTELNLSAVIPADKVTGGSKLKIWVKGTTAGKLKIKLTPSTSTSGRFVVQPPAELEMGVAELKLEVYEQDSAEIAKLQVDPDQEPISQYHTDLESTNLPPQIVLSDENKIKRGRLLHAQDGGNFGRSKIVVKALTAAQFPADDGNCHITVNTGGKSGALKLFDAEFDGNEIPLPLKIDKADLSADKIYWMEGADESNALRETRLDIGLGLAGKPSKNNGDWASFTVAKIKDISLDYTQPAGGPNAWDSANKRFFINMQTGDAGRKIKAKLNLGKALEGVVVHFMLVEDKDNRKVANWGVDLPSNPSVHEWIWKDIDPAVKHLDKDDRKNILHYSVKTDVNGMASKELKLSQFGGDKFYLAAYIEQDPHLAKYVHAHSTLDKRKPVMAADEINVWRKFWYQEIKVSGVVTSGVKNAADCYEDVKVVMEKAPEKVIPLSEAKLLNPSAIYPKHMINYYYDTTTYAYKNNYPNDLSDGLVICDSRPARVHENKFFPAPVNIPERPVTIAMINADGQWDPDGNDTLGPYPWTESGFPMDIKSSKKLLDPPLQGGGLLISGRLVAEDWDPSANGGSGAWINNRRINLTSSDLALNPARSSASDLRINKPSTLIMAVKTRIQIQTLQIKCADSFLGMSLSNGIVNVYTPNDELDFVDTINHEIGHSFNQVATTAPTGIPSHPYQYNSQGSHCNYVSKSCLMYESGPQTAALHRYCPVCHPHVLVQDMSTV